MNNNKSQISSNMIQVVVRSHPNVEFFHNPLPHESFQKL